MRIATASVRTDLAMTAFLHGVWCVLLWCVGAGFAPPAGDREGRPYGWAARGAVNGASGTPSLTDALLRMR